MGSDLDKFIATLHEDLGRIAAYVEAKEATQKTPSPKKNPLQTEESLKAMAKFDLGPDAVHKALEHNFDYGGVNGRDLASSSRLHLTAPSPSYQKEYISHIYTKELAAKEGALVSIAAAADASRRIIPAKDLKPGDTAQMIFFKAQPLSDNPLMASVLEQVTRFQTKPDPIIDFRAGKLKAQYKLLDDSWGSVVIDTTKYIGELFYFDEELNSHTEELKPAAIKELLPVYLKPMEARTITKDWLEGKIPRE